MPKVKKRYRIMVFVILLLQSLFTMGCWDRVSLSKRAIVVGMGFDSSPQEEKILISAQIVDPTNVRTPRSGGGGNEPPFWIATSQGTTVFEAIRTMTHVSPRKLFFPHNQVMIFGEELAKRGLKDHLDMLMRDYEFRETNWILVSEGKAQDILATETRINNIPAFFIRDLIIERRFSSQFGVINIKDLSQRILSKSTAPIASYIFLEDTDEEQRLNMSGTAVFDRDMKMVGILNKRESRGLLWVLGEVRGGIIVVTDPDQCTYSLEILEATSKIIPQYKDGKPTITVQIKGSSNLGETSCTEDLNKPEAWQFMESLQNEAICQEVTAALAKAQELKADVFGFGDAFYKKHLRVWRELESNWQEIFPTLEVNIIVESTVKRPGLIISNVYSDKGE